MSDIISEFVDHVIAENPTHRVFLEQAVRGLTSEDESDLEAYLSYCREQSLTTDQMADAYNTIVVDTQMEQIYFRRAGSYRFASFAEAAEEVYFNPDYMSKYMYGLAISSFLWPNHNQMHHFFLRHLPRAGGGNYLEVGPGHGYYFMRAAELGGFDSLQGIDISPTSIDITRSVLDHFGVLADSGDRIRLDVSDFLTAELPTAEHAMIVMGEVLEHVERPDQFMSRLRELVADDGTVYVTTCVNAPAVDHIYLFATTDEVDQLVVDAGFEIVDHLFVPYAGQTLAQCREERLAINVCYVLKPA